MKVMNKGSNSENKFYKPPPIANPFTPVMKPADEEKISYKSQKSIKQIQRESKKQNYMEDFIKAQEMMDDSVNNPDESINFDDNSNSDEEVKENMLRSLHAYPQRNLRPNAIGRQSLKNIKAKEGNLMQKAGNKKTEGENPFVKKKKKGLGSTLSNVFKGIF